MCSKYYNGDSCTHDLMILGQIKYFGHTDGVYNHVITHVILIMRINVLEYFYETFVDYNCVKNYLIFGTDNYGSIAENFR